MMVNLDRSSRPANPQPRFQVPVPYAPPQGIGAGDVIARVTQALGIRTCTPCQRRQQILNQALRFRQW